MDRIEADLKERLKQRLFASISAQVDAIGYVPRDIARLAGDLELGPAAGGESAAATGESGAPGSADAAPDRDRLARAVNGHYDSAFYDRDGIMGRLLGRTDYRNIGYWDETTATQDEACRRLQDALLDFIPAKTGRILDVACGMGASTRRLLDHYPAEDVWAINISEKQVATARQNAPGAHVQVMNAVELTFEDGFFDNVLCIEAAFHFETRRRFLEEARRVLKSGGRLVLSDVLFTSRERLEQYPVFPSPDNHLDTVEGYRALLAEVGFRDVVVKDVSREVWGAHFLHLVQRAHEEFLDGNLDIVRLTDALWTYYHLNAITGLCLFVSAQK